MWWFLNCSSLLLKVQFISFNQLSSGIWVWAVITLSQLFACFRRQACFLKEYRMYRGTSLVAQMVKNLPAVQETRVWSLGQEDPLEKGMATHSSILAWRIPWTEEPGQLWSLKSQRVGHDWVTNTTEQKMSGNPRAGASVISLASAAPLYPSAAEKGMSQSPGQQLKPMSSTINDIHLLSYRFLDTQVRPTIVLNLDFFPPKSPLDKRFCLFM